ncbi:zinc finger bed domain-containing protein 1-like [Gigaspora margarita]|uniref:Zinc finger bed domain-containing protein 1-like n=1 Tax=Gigaspora margarita TaxID=4874 RepID=A0A8H4AYG6_GIGMA|nr:zinc finger bed domain-containing protein 1-like [Gigaspora margarita]
MASQNLSSIAVSSMVLDISTSVASCDSPSMVSHYSSEEIEIKNKLRPKHSEGRPLDPVWDHFFATPLKSPEHFSTKCRYCLKQFSRGRPTDLEVHLAKECEDESFDDEIRGKYIEIVIQRQQLKEKTSSKNQSKKQKLNINDF